MFSQHCSSISGSIYLRVELNMQRHVYIQSFMTEAGGRQQPPDLWPEKGNSLQLLHVSVRQCGRQDVDRDQKPGVNSKQSLNAGN